MDTTTKQRQQDEECRRLLTLARSKEGKVVLEARLAFPKVNYEQWMEWKNSNRHERLYARMAERLVERVLMQIADTEPTFDQFLNEKPE